MAGGMSGPRTLTVLSSFGIYGILTELAPDFERENGCTLRTRFDPANELIDKIEAGKRFDVAILTAPLVDRLIGAGVIARGTRADIASSGIGVAVGAGAPKPDISTGEAFIRALREARSIIGTARGASGVHMAALLDRLGIADEITPKLTRITTGLVAEAVARGEAELGIQQMSELLAVPGIDIVGPLPPEFQHATMFSAGLSPAAADDPLARALVARLTAPETAPLIRAKGLDPA